MVYRIKKTKYKNHIINPKQKHKKRHTKSVIKNIIKYFILSTFGILILGWIILAFWLQKNVYSGLPEVNNIKNMVFSQTTEIQDKHGNILYKLFQENREYVPFEEISLHMIHAIVAMEDQRYWEHWGLDPWGILRAVIKRIISGQNSGASTLTQQLLKNLLLNPWLKKESTKQKIVRKLREFVLASKLEKSLQAEIRKEEGKLSKEEVHLKMKEQTLELYLNFIWLGNNAYGVEAAANTYFGISAKELSVLQSAIIASLPQAPSYYNPYKNKSRIMWKLVIKNSDGSEADLGTGSTLQNIAIEKLKTALTQTNLSDKKENSDFTEFIKWLWSFTITNASKTYNVTYELWRKDAVLARMYEDSYIDQMELKNAFLQWLDFTFHQKKFEIKAPHFVHWIIEELEKNYDKEILMNNWLVVKTTLDYDIQQIAEKAIKDNKKNLEYYGANNEAMIYIDSSNGDVLAYIGSVDYFDENIEWQNDMVRRPRQPGSSIKPLIYSRWFEKLPLTLDTPIYDIPFQIGSLAPNNADGKFYGIMPLKNALAYSRNIPAAKVFLWMGGENIVKPFLRDLWLTSLQEDHNYGYSMALWAWEVPMIEMANAYMHLSATGKPAVINPILEIRSSDGAIIYQKEIEKQKEVIKPGIAYLIRKILSDKANMPPGWVKYYSVNGLQLWIKSWTSNMKTPRWDRARDWRLIWYTPTWVTIFRWWNTNGKEMYKNAYGWFLNSHALTQFWKDLLKNNYISNKDMPSVEVAQVTISKITGKISGEGTPNEFKVSTLAYAYNQPNSVDDGMKPIQIDKKCNGLVGPYTPKEDIINWYLITASSFMPNNMDLNWITKRREESVTGSWFVTQQWDTKKKPKVTYNYGNIFIKEPTEYCEWRIPQIDQKIKIKILKPIANNNVTPNFSVRYSVDSSKHIEKVLFYINDEIITTFDENLWKDFTRIENIVIPDKFLNKTVTLKIEAIDSSVFSNSSKIKIHITNNPDTTPPVLLNNKIQVSGKEWNYRVLLLFEDDLSGVLWWRIARDGKIIYTFSWSLVNFTTSSLNPIDVVAFDSYQNLVKENINLFDYYWYWYSN